MTANEILSPGWGVRTANPLCIVFVLIEGYSTIMVELWELPSISCLVNTENIFSEILVSVKFKVNWSFKTYRWTANVRRGLEVCNN